MNISTRKGVTILCIVIAFSLVLSACGDLSAAAGEKSDKTKESKGGGGKEWKDKDIDDLMAIIDSASKLAPLTPKHDVEVVDEYEDAEFRYITEKHNVIANKESVLFMGLNDDVLFPGALIQGTGVYDFVYNPIITSRSPITLSLSLEGTPTTGESIKITVDDPSKLSNVRQGINDLLKTAITPETTVPAKFSYETTQVYSSEEMNLAVGVSGSYASVSMSHDFNWSSETKKNKIMSIYKQVYYTVDIDMPPYPYTFFDPSMGVEGVRAALPAGSMPMYVSSVSYGWMAVLFIETDYSREEMETALSIAYESGVVDGSINVDYDTKKVLESSSIYILVYGGSTAGITSSTLEGLSGLTELITGSKNFGSDSPGVPLSYKLRHLSDNLIAQVALTEEYSLSKAVRIREFVKIKLDYFYCTWDYDGTGATDLLDMDRFFFWVAVYRGSQQLSNDMILNWWYSDEWDMDQGDSWYPPTLSQTVVKLDLEDYSIGSYNIVLTAHARDYDGSDAASDWAKGSIWINGNDIYDPSNLFFEIEEPSNMGFEVWYTIEPATLDEYCSYHAEDALCP